MAIYRPGTIVQAVSGTLGGQCFTRSKSGPVLRHRPAKINQRSALQINRRARYPMFHLQWLDLTTAERAAWRAAAQTFTIDNRFGVPIHLSAFQLWMKAALSMPPGWDTMPTEPPNTFHLPSFTDITIAFQSGVSYIITTNTPFSGPKPIWQLLYISRPYTNRVLGFYRDWDYVGIKAHLGIPVNFTAPVQAKYGDLTKFEVVGVRVYYFIEGYFLSAPLFDTTKVA